MTEPRLRIVRGDAGPEEIAALVIALTGRDATPESPSFPVRHPWRDPAHRMRKPLAHGPGAWRSSSLPI
ncbi:acetyl-CoA carboxylase biotin carboxyl carrier protein subunit [Microtetraspora sp. NBRC 13810]|uniref:acyl-CoA carboxylase subunit epsilon n=1 Tax=Microtetraspora sp. NBRC 13810 TaxID=3030990 RepID=UPI0024A3B5F9|nr:acyl-CoA carboxylase subunit epsilon [Microtetraspora sp. NBRC 13810]GLW05437.1 acetyl-CoA carboxylase biotin carboxyl carrier protein subunit [Microtetraspora sp. NBRC 13810]